MTRLAALALAAAAVCAAENAGDLEEIRRARYVMGTVFEIRVLGMDRDAASRAVDQAFTAIREVDETLSDYRQDSELTRLNESPHADTFAASEALFEPLRQALRLSEATGGAFDPTVGPYVKAWRRAAELGRVPDEDLVAVGWGHVLLDAERREVRRTAAVEIDFGGIGKGWALDRAAEILRAAGVERAYLSAGTSTILAIGDGPDGNGWRVGVRDPLGEEEDAAFWVTLRNEALSTSAAYEKFYEIDGCRYGHILDPRSGRPVENGVLSATVRCPGATEADALSTAAYVLGDAAALSPELSCETILLRQDGDGRLVIDGARTE